MANLTAAMLVIGDEILSGRTRDVNAHVLASALTDIGVTLSEVRMVPDIAARIAEAVNDLRARYDTVFTSGGIGPTHDDITADSIAGAFGVAIDVRDDALHILQAHYDKSGFELNEARLRMARIPASATLIENSVSAAPGFTLENVHVLAGVPSIFTAMLDAVLPTLRHGQAVLSQTIRLERPEGEIAAVLGHFATEHPDISFGSYPFHADGVYGTNIVVRSADSAKLKSVTNSLLAALPEGAIL